MRDMPDMPDDRRGSGRSSPLGGFTAPPADTGLSIDRLAQAFASMMGESPSAGSLGVVSPETTEAGIEIDASPDLDAADTAFRVTPKSILEAMLFVGLPGGEPLSSRKVASLMRGVRPQEIDDLAIELRDSYAAENRPYEVVSQGDGWRMQLRQEHEAFAAVLEQRSRTVRLDRESLDVLATVAWNQPVATQKLVELGCDARPATLRQLVRRGLLELIRDADGEATYTTTQKFLDLFKLASVRDLPKPSAPPG
jgi:segregation and condensation protein B